MGFHRILWKAGSTYATFTIYLSEKSSTTVALSTAPPLVKDGFFAGTKRPPLFPAPLKHMRLVTKPEPHGVSWKADVTIEKGKEEPALHPVTTYHFVVSSPAKNEQKKNGFWFTTGKLETGRKLAFINLDRIHVSDDSDPFATGELQFAFFANDQVIGKYPWDGATSIASGQNVQFPPYSMAYFQTKSDVKNHLDLIAIGRDHDGPFNPFPVVELDPYIWPPLPDQASTDVGLYEYSRGETELRLVGDKKNPKRPENFKDAFSVIAKGGDGSDLEYECFGNFEIREIESMGMVGF